MGPQGASEEPEARFKRGATRKGYQLGLQGASTRSVADDIDCDACSISDSTRMQWPAMHRPNEHAI
eukprot:7250665-Pyramimonas_sp.AAC.1